MSFDYAVRVKAATVLLLLAALYLGVTTLRGGWPEEARQDVSQDWIAIYTSRFDELGEALPPDGVVGYVTDQPPYPGSDYLLTQYALSPVVVERGVARKLVVGNFHDPARMAGIAAREGLVLIRSYDHGVALFRGHGE